MPPLLFGATLCFYVYTLLPSLAWVDGMKHQQEVISGESLTLAEFDDSLFAPDPFPFARLGVAAWDHPLYVIVGHTVVQLLPGVDPLWLVNLYSAVFGAAAVALIYRLCYVHSQSTSASLGAALSLAVSHTFWFHSVTPETYTILSFALLLSISLYAEYMRAGRVSLLIGSLFVLGLGAATHLLAFMAFPAAAVYLALSPGAFRRPPPANLRRMVVAGTAFLAGFSPYLIQFLRMLRTFPITQVIGPVAGSFFVRDVLVSTTPVLVGQSALYYLMLLAMQFGPVGVALGLYGWWAGLRRNQGKAGGAAPAVKTPEDVAPAGGAASSRPVVSLWRLAIAFYAVFTIFGIFYRVQEQYAVFLFSHMFWSLAIGLGAARLLSILPGRRRPWLLFGLGAGIVIMPLYYSALPGLARAAGLSDESFAIPPVGTGARDGLRYFLNPNKRGYDAPYVFGRETLANLPPRSIVIAEWYHDVDEALVLRYFQTIEGMRPDVEIVIWLLEEPTNFDATKAVRRVESGLQDDRPVFLASLSDKFYDASRLKQTYCIVPEDNLYRVYPGRPSELSSQGMSCVK